MSFCVLSTKKKERKTMQVGELQLPWIPGSNPSRDSPRDCAEQMICYKMIHWPQTVGETAGGFSRGFSLVFFLLCFLLSFFQASCFPCTISFSHCCDSSSFSSQLIARPIKLNHFSYKTKEICKWNDKITTNPLIT